MSHIIIGGHMIRSGLELKAINTKTQKYNSLELVGYTDQTKIFTFIARAIQNEHIKDIAFFDCTIEDATFDNLMTLFGNKRTMGEIVFCDCNLPTNRKSISNSIETIRIGSSKDFVLKKRDEPNENHAHNGTIQESNQTMNNTVDRAFEFWRNKVGESKNASIRTP